MNRRQFIQTAAGAAAAAHFKPAINALAPDGPIAVTIYKSLPDGYYPVMTIPAEVIAAQKLYNSILNASLDIISARL